MMKAKQGMVILTSLMLVLFAACSEDGAVNTDGDTEFGGDGWDPTEIGCNDDSECRKDQRCMLNDKNEKVCSYMFCSDTYQCEDVLGEGCYCQGGIKCVCEGVVDGDDAEGEADGDILPDGDTVVSECIYAEPSVIHFGAVRIGQKSSKDVNICNLCDYSVTLNDSMVIWADGGSTDVTEFDLVGNIPADKNPILLVPDDCHTIKTTYAPRNPGKDIARLLVSPSVGANLKIPMDSELKGQITLELACEEWDEDVKAFTFGLVPVDTVVSRTCWVSNANTSTDDNNVLEIRELIIPTGDDSLNFAIDYTTVKYNSETGREIWLSPGEKEPFTVTYAPRQPAVHRAQLRVKHNDTNKTDPYAADIIGAGVIPLISINPFPTIRFGNVEKGTCATRTVNISNIGGAALHLFEIDWEDKVSSTGAVFSFPESTLPTLPLTIEPGITKVPVEVMCCPVGREAYFNNLIITSDNEANAKDYTRVGVTCTGTTANCDISPINLDWGCGRVGGAEQSRLVRVTNNGQATATVNQIAITGNGNFFLTEQYYFPIEIIPGNSLEIDVAHVCTAEGLDDAVLTISPEGGECVQTEVSLKACCTQPVIQGPTECLKWEGTQVPPQVIPPEQKELWKEEREVLITNNGSDTLTIGQIFLSNSSEEFEIIYPGLPALVAPGLSWGFKVNYLPETYGTDYATVVLCSDAGNGTPGSGYKCQDATYSPFEICLEGSAIDPRLFITPREGKCVFRNVLVGHEQSCLITVENTGTGPLTIESVEMGGGTPTFSIPDGGLTPDKPDWGEEGLVLEGSKTLSIVVKFAPTFEGSNYNTVEIKHSDKDAAKFGGTVGNAYPIYKFELFGSSGENTTPIAIAKSPVGTPPGQWGTLQRTIGLGEEINLDGQESYDLDDDPDTTDIKEDYIVSYGWKVNSGPANGMVFTGPLNSQVTSARFDKPGSYEVQLTVVDSRGASSNDSMRDSKILINVQDAPVAIAYICNTGGETSASVEVGKPVCFDGSASEDSDGTITDYRWYVQKLGGPKSNFAVGQSKPSYTFTQSGTYTVSLVVVDNEGNQSENDAFIEVEAFANQPLRVEMIWSGQGDVDLHYIRPQGYFGDFSDCNKNNPNPNWGPQGYGHPKFKQDSGNGIAPEVVEHLDPGDSTASYTVTATYITPTQTCGNVVTQRCYDDNCDICGCDCKPFCWILRICCISCCENEHEWVCNDVAANLTFRVYTGSDYPAFTVAGPDVKVEHAGNKYSFSLRRTAGVWSL